MAALMTNDGAERMALIKLGKRTFQDMVVGLYKNNYTPVVTSVLSNFTPSTLTTELTIDKTSWAGVASGGSWTGSCTPLVFPLSANTGGEAIYGYYVRDQDNKILWAEKYASPFTPPNAVSSWIVAPNDTHHQG
jgi:hypothetical protein